MQIQLFLSLKVKFKYSCGNFKPSSRLIAFSPQTLISQASKIRLSYHLEHVRKISAESHEIEWPVQLIQLSSGKNNN